MFDERFLGHRGPVGHPERPERLRASVDALAQQGLLEMVQQLAPPLASDEALARVHSAAYLERLSAIDGKAGLLDGGDTYFSPGSYEAARLAAGACATLVEQIIAGELQNGLALVRPPGHHARREGGGGFCLINNIAVAAATATALGKRVAIIDFDVHHGNGTQDIFYRTSDVFFASLHRFGGGYYPGTGAPSERGADAGMGTTLNVAMEPGAGSDDHLCALDETIAPALERFSPEMILVSAGFDAHRDDPLGGQRVDDEGFSQMIARIDQWASTLCGGKWLAVLEGGYDLDALSAGVAALLRRMLGPQRARGASL